MPELIYGINNEKLVHINEVENGIKCNCLCPNCGAKLIAKKGKIKEHHFAHESKECDVTVAQESALHIMAKEILLESKYIKLPSVYLNDDYAFLPREEYNKIESFGVFVSDALIYDYSKYKESSKKIDNVILEKYIENIKPDILITSEGKQLMVEIAVTHFIDEIKMNKLRNIKIPTIEIDLSSYKDKINSLTREDIKDIILNDTLNKKWIWYSKYEDDINEIIQYNKFVIDKLNKIHNEKYEYLTIEYEDAYIHALQKDAIIGDSWNDLKISKYFQDTIPWFIGYPIYGDILLNNDRKLWQMIIVDKLFFSNNGIDVKYFINYIKNNKKFQLHNDYIWGRYIVDEGDATLIKYETINIREHLPCEITADEVIKKYYLFLEEEKIIDSHGKWIYRKSILK